MNQLKERKNVTIRVGFENMEFTAVPMEEVKKTDDAIQRKVQPLIDEHKRIRKAAEKTVSKIVLNA